MIPNRVRELYDTLEDKLGAVMLETPNNSLNSQVWAVVYNNEAELAELEGLGHTEDDVATNLKDAVIEGQQEAACSAEYEGHYQ